jgi:predicted ATP-binding protein involved in virulence
LEKYSVIKKINTTTIYNMEQLFNETQELLQKNSYAREYVFHIIDMIGDKPLRQLTTSEKKYWKTKEQLAPIYALKKMGEKYSFEELMKNPYMKEKILFYYFCEKIGHQEVMKHKRKRKKNKNKKKKRTKK